MEKTMSLKNFLLKHPLHAADVGAHGGVIEHWSPYIEMMRVSAFDPNEKDCQKQALLSHPNVSWYPFALAGKTERRNLYILNQETGSSLYPPNPNVLNQFNSDNYSKLKEVKEVACTSYPDFIKKTQSRVPVLLKLDIQGAELEVLDSLLAFSDKEVFGVETEIEFVEVYKGQPLFFDVDRMMKSYGFELLDIRTHRAYRSKSGEEKYYLRKFFDTRMGSPLVGAQLVAGDALYFKRYDHPHVQKSKETLLHYILMGIIYRFFEWSLIAVEHGISNRIISKEEGELLTQEIISFAPKPKFYMKRNFFGKSVAKLGRTFLGKKDGYQAFWTERSW